MNRYKSKHRPEFSYRQLVSGLIPLIKACPPILITLIAILGCKPSATSNRSSANDAGPIVSSSPASNSEGRFDVNEICSLPKEVAPNTPFGKLGGGRWARTSNFDEEWDYDCEGDTDFLQSEENEKGTIALEYGAIGGPNDVKYISVEYTATRFNGLDKSEMENRKGYVDFVDRISKRLFKEPLPDSVKKQLLGTKDVRKEDSGTPVGSGYVNTSVNLTGNTAVMTDIHFFESRDAFERYKDK